MSTTTTTAAAADRNRFQGIDFPELDDSPPPVRDTVCVVESAWLGRMGVCTCGWQGRQRRIFRSAVVVDALTHAYATGHEPAVPLVVPAG
jgi:hypothetical protein